MYAPLDASASGVTGPSRKGGGGSSHKGTTRLVTVSVTVPIRKRSRLPLYHSVARPPP
jgi:hypothetical protein